MVTEKMEKNQKQHAGIDLGLTEAEKNYLRRLAMAEITARFRQPDPLPEAPAGGHLEEKRGAFVTLTKQGVLRGCIGHIQGTRPLVETIREMARAAAFSDPRFPPVAEAELDQLELEISVLTPLRLIKDVEEIKVGIHGLYIECQGYAGLLLPQVATEYDWGREEFLAHTCMKAGLSSNCWRQPETRIYIFSADIF
jgi:AmmeMemoRadiSam system protein A